MGGCSAVFEGRIVRIRLAFVSNHLGDSQAVAVQVLWSETSADHTCWFTATSVVPEANIAKHTRGFRDKSYAYLPLVTGS